MKCPKCKTENKFAVDKSSVYCIARPGGEFCGYTLTKQEKEYYRNEKKILSGNATLKTIRKYEGLSLNQIAKLNNLHRNTVRKYSDQFDAIQGTLRKRYQFNKKVFKENWKTKLEKEMEGYIEISYLSADYYTIGEAASRINYNLKSFINSFVSTGKIKVHFFDHEKYIDKKEFKEFINSEFK